MGSGMEQIIRRAIEVRHARMVMIAHSKATFVFFRTSYHGHPGTSVFNRSIEGEYGHLKLGSYIYSPKGMLIICNYAHLVTKSFASKPFLPLLCGKGKSMGQGCFSVKWWY